MADAGDYAYSDPDGRFAYGPPMTNDESDRFKDAIGALASARANEDEIAGRPADQAFRYQRSQYRGF